MVLNIWIGRLLPAYAEVVTSVRLHIGIRSFSSGRWHDMYNDRPLFLDNTLRINNKQLSSVLTSLRYVQLVITARQMIGRKFSTQNMKPAKKYVNTNQQISVSNSRKFDVLQEDAR
jgi:hypothetical protein